MADGLADILVERDLFVVSSDQYLGMEPAGRQYHTNSSYQRHQSDCRSHGALPRFFVRVTLPRRALTAPERHRVEGGRRRFGRLRPAAERGALLSAAQTRSPT